jgi:DNA invertase Pin-like site-specific DNA recombinase
MNGPIPYVVYASKSTEDAHDSIPTQLETVAAKVAGEAEERVEYAGPFYEASKSGFKRSRGPELERALVAVKEAAAVHGQAELWVWKSDRLARGSGRKAEARSLLEVYADLKREGVTIRSVLDDPYVQDEVTVGMASKMANKYSADLSEATKAGKQRMYDRGERPGGPVQDGMRLVVERDENDRVVSRTYLPDEGERGLVIGRLFDLADEGHGDATVGQKLNSEGHRKKSGEPWDRRSVQHIIENPGYAGRIVRPAEGDRPAEVIQAKNIVPLIPPDRYDRILKARKSRDRAKGDKRRRGGRPTTKFVLAKLGTCDRCGSRLYARRSPYVRKDGTSARHYVCAQVVNQTGLCDMPHIDAEVMDAAVVEYLDQLFVDIEGWRDGTEAAREKARGAALVGIEQTEDELARLDRLAEKVQADYLRQLDADDEDAAQIAAEARKGLETQRLAKLAELEMRQAALADIDAPTDDAMLDTWSALKRAVREGSKEVAALNERLRAKFATFRIEWIDGEEVAAVAPVLLPQVIENSPLPLLEALRRVSEGQEPTPEEIADYEEQERRCVAEELIVVPTKAALVQMGQDTQLYLCTKPKRVALAASHA